MATVKRHDFVEIEYTARLKEDNTIFDTTEEKVAKENSIYDKDSDYNPLVICIGENSILKGLEEQIIGKETGKDYTFEINHENAFGKKDARLIQLVPVSKFRQQNIQPVPGLQLNIDGVFGIVKTVSGGRCLVDFNHPLSGRDLVYEVKINKIIDDNKEKIEALLKTHLRIKDAEIELKDESNASELVAGERVSSRASHVTRTRSQVTANITLKHKIPQQAQEEFVNIVNKTIPGIKNVSFAEAKETNK